MSHAFSERLVTLPRNAEASGLARSFLAEACCADRHAGVLEDAQLLVSELVTNAVRHGGPPITLCVRCDGSSDMQVRVSDGNVHQPQVKHPEATEEGGRGMMLVDLISEHWGVDTDDDGKVVWFQLRTP